MRRIAAITLLAGTFALAQPPHDYRWVDPSGAAASTVGWGLFQNASIPNVDLGVAIISGIADGYKGATPRQAAALDVPGFTLVQPTDPIRLIFGYRPAAFAGRAEGTQRAYLLNVALKQLLPGSSQPVDAPNFVDFLDLTGAYETRIDLDQGATAYFEPSDMALSQNGRRLVVAARGSDKTFFPNNAVPPHLAIIDTAVARFEKRIVFPDTLWPTNVVLSADGSTAYVGMTTLNGTQITGTPAIHVIDINSGITQATIPLPAGGRTGEMVLTPDGALLFVLAGVQLHEIDVRSRTVVTQISASPVAQPTVPALRESTQLAMNPQGTKLYLIDAAAPQNSSDFNTVGVGVVDIATATLTDLIPLPGTIRRGSGDDIQTAFGGRVIVAVDGVSGLMTFLDAASFKVMHQTDRGQNLFRVVLAEGP